MNKSVRFQYFTKNISNCAFKIYTWIQTTLNGLISLFNLWSTLVLTFFSKFELNGKMLIVLNMVHLSSLWARRLSRCLGHSVNEMMSNLAPTSFTSSFFIMKTLSHFSWNRRKILERFSIQACPKPSPLSPKLLPQVSVNS